MEPGALARLSFAGNYERLLNSCESAGQARAILKIAVYGFYVRESARLFGRARHETQPRILLRKQFRDSPADVTGSTGNEDHGVIPAIHAATFIRQANDLNRSRSCV